MKNLNPKILTFLSKHLEITPHSIQNSLTKLGNDNPSLTRNGLAFLYARARRVNIGRFLDSEDKSSLSTIKVKPALEVIEKKEKKKEKLEAILRFETTDAFIKGHVDELNRAYTYKCYTACFILARKIVENLIIDLLRKRYPETSRTNKELYFDIAQNRFKDFGIVLKNLYDKKNDFGSNNAVVEKLYVEALRLKDDANNKTHSWYHLVRRKEEIDNLNIQDVVDLIKIIS